MGRGVRVIQEWKCGYCNSTQTSDSTELHKMDYCDCGKSAIDLEEGYSRWVGNPVLIKSS